MENAVKFRNKIRNGHVCLGTLISSTDPTTTEMLSRLFDFVWIEMEHTAFSLETVERHIVAMRGSEAASLVRVRWNDPVLIKPVLDMGADGIIVPMIHTAEEARAAVAACRYPPEGIRGFGPRRPAKFGQLRGPEFCRLANESIIVIVQIEHIDAVRNLNDILAVPGLTGILVGPNDLAGSMGLMGQPEHPEVVRAMETIVAKARPTHVWASVSVGGGPEVLGQWIERGVKWLTVGDDLGFMSRAAHQMVSAIRGSA
jgi:2-keto-3-deoxy-L-rhamnonate aldolase RhmA